MSGTWTVEEVAARVEPGMTVGIGGWGSRRKPMELVAAVARRGVGDLTVVSYGGPDVGLLCALGLVRRLVFGFVSLDTIPLEPWFRRARQEGTLPEVMELDEGMVLQGLRAAAWGVPFLPMRAGLGSAVVDTNPQLRTVRSPYADDTELLAMPALPLDVALVHVHRAEADGTGQVLGIDPYMDAWMCRAAREAYVSCERLGLDPDQPKSCIVDGTCVDGVVVAPGGAWFTDCSPDYPRDQAALEAYAATAKDPVAWATWRQERGL
ncbi:MAG: CoA transferase subunit A [Alphaproteobacteria bacterium]|nr:CoA transferase subunit A [Alphaproteobacteria bacterium]